MLSVIVTPGDPRRLAGLLAVLTSAAVEGLVRDVQLVAGGDPALLEALCEATGAATAESLPQAVRTARSDWLIVAPPTLRLADGWVERLGDHLREGGGEARLVGAASGWLQRLSRRGPQGVLIARAKASASAQGGLEKLARQLGRGALRLG
jgi:hypothetical protein